jgi:hypothetical protein
MSGGIVGGVGDGTYKVSGEASFVSAAVGSVVVVVDFTVDELSPKRPFQIVYHRLNISIGISLLGSLA